MPLHNSYFVYVLKIEYGLFIWLKVLFIICPYTTKIFFWNSPMHKKGYSCYWTCIFVQKPSFLWSKPSFNQKGFAHRGISFFILDPFSPSLLAQNINFRYIFHFEYITEVWISGVLGVKSFPITNYLPFFSQQSELLGYIDPQLPTPHLKFPVHCLSLSQSPSSIWQGLVSEQHVQKLVHAENEFC